MAVTPEQLAEWRRLCEAATPGPWFCNERTGEFCHGDPDNDEYNWVIGDVDDMAFFAAARDGWPATMDALEAATAERDRLRTERDKLLVERGFLREGHQRYKEALKAIAPNMPLVDPVRVARAALECDQHYWVDTRNDAVLSGEMCMKCHAVREGNET